MFGQCSLTSTLLCVMTRSPRSLRTNADDCLPVAALGRVEGGNGVVEVGHGADVRAQAAVPHPLDDLGQLAAIGFDDEIHRQAVSRPRLERADDRYQRSASLDQCRGALL